MTAAGAEVLVVGGGIAGSTIAWELARVGAPVTLLRSARPRASLVAAGMLAPMPESAAAAALTHLASQALHHYPTFLEALAEDSSVDVGFRRCGLLRLAGDETARAALREEVGSYEAAGLPSQWLEARPLLELAPGLPASIAGGLLSFDEAQVQPAWLLAALEDAAEHRGVRQLTAEVLALAADGREVTLVDGTRLGADRVVLAAGSWSGQLGGAQVPVRPVKGQLLVFEDALGPEPIVYAGHDYVVTKPDGTVLVGGTVEEAGFSVDPSPAGEALRELVPRLWPSLDGRPARVRAGLRPATPDGRPVCGPLPGRAAVYAFTGHYRNGFLLCPHGAHLAVNEIVHNQPQPLFKGLRPGRFLESPG
jgi:glycine oxidase